MVINAGEIQGSVTLNIKDLRTKLLQAEQDVKSFGSTAESEMKSYESAVRTMLSKSGKELNSYIKDVERVRKIYAELSKDTKDTDLQKVYKDLAKAAGDAIAKDKQYQTSVEARRQTAKKASEEEKAALALQSSLRASYETDRKTADKVTEETAKKQAEFGKQAMQERLKELREYEAERKTGDLFQEEITKKQAEFDKQAHQENIAMLKEQERIRESSFTGQLKQAAKNITAYGVVLKLMKAIKAIAADIIKRASAFEQQMANIKAVTESSTAQMSLLEAAAKNIGLTTKFSASEAASALYELAKAGASATESVQMLDGVMAMSQATGENITRTAEVIISVVKQFGLVASDSTKVANTLTAGIVKSLAEMDDYKVALQQIGPIASAAGRSLEEVVGIVDIMLDKGVAASRSGRAMRNMLIELSNSSSVTAKRLNALGISFDKVDVTSNSLIDVFKNLKASGISIGQVGAAFGKTISSQITAVLSSTNAQLEQAVEEVTNTTMALSAAEIQVDTLEGSVGKLKATWDVFATNLGTSAIPIARWFIDAARDATSFLNSMVELSQGNKTASDRLLRLNNELEKSGQNFTVNSYKFKQAEIDTNKLTEAQKKLLIQQNLLARREALDNLEKQRKEYEKQLKALDDLEAKIKAIPMVEELTDLLAQMREVVGFGSGKLSPDQTEKFEALREQFLSLYNIAAMDSGFKNLNANLKRELAQMVSTLVSSTGAGRNWIQKTLPDKKDLEDYVYALHVLNVGETGNGGLVGEFETMDATTTQAMIKLKKSIQTGLFTLQDVEDISPGIAEAVSKVTEGMVKASDALGEGADTTEASDAAQSYIEKLKEIGKTELELIDIQRKRALAEVNAFESSAYDIRRAENAINKYYDALVKNANPAIKALEDIKKSVSEAYDELFELKLDTATVRMLALNKALIGVDKASQDAKDITNRFKELWSILDETASIKATEDITELTQEYIEKLEDLNATETEAIELDRKRELAALDATYTLTTATKEETEAYNAARDAINAYFDAMQTSSGVSVYSEIIEEIDSASDAYWQASLSSEEYRQRQLAVAQSLATTQEEVQGLKDRYEELWRLLDETTAIKTHEKLVEQLESYRQKLEDIDVSEVQSVERQRAQAKEALNLDTLYESLAGKYGLMNEGIAKGLGNIDLNNRKIIDNLDGTKSTLASITVGFDDYIAVIPTAVNGALVSADEAIEHYLTSGEHLGLFDVIQKQGETWEDAVIRTQEEANEYARILHQFEEDKLEYTTEDIDIVDRYFDAQIEGIRKKYLEELKSQVKTTNRDALVTAALEFDADALQDNMSTSLTLINKYHDIQYKLAKITNEKATDDLKDSYQDRIDSLVESYAKGLIETEDYEEQKAQLEEEFTAEHAALLAKQELDSKTLNKNRKKDQEEYFEYVRDQILSLAETYVDVYQEITDAVVASIEAQITALEEKHDKEMELLEEKRNAELLVAGIAEDEERESLEKTLLAAKKAGDEEAIIEARKALLKYDINKKYDDMILEAEEELAKQTAELQYKSDLQTYYSNIVSAISAQALAVAQVWASPGLFWVKIAQSVAAAATVGAQIAALRANKPTPPAYATGGIVKGTNAGTEILAGENNRTEAILNPDQMANILMAIGSGQLSPAQSQVQNMEIYLQLDGKTVASSSAQYYNNGIILISERGIRKAR